MEGTVWKVLYLNGTALEGTLLKFLYVECKVPGSYSTWNVLSLDDNICARFCLLKVLSQESTIQLIYCLCTSAVLCILKALSLKCLHLQSTVLNGTVHGMYCPWKKHRKPSSSC